MTFKHIVCIVQIEISKTRGKRKRGERGGRKGNKRVSECWQMLQLENAVILTDRDKQNRDKHVWWLVMMVMIGQTRTLMKTFWNTCHQASDAWLSFNWLLIHNNTIYCQTHTDCRKSKLQWSYSKTSNFLQDVLCWFIDSFSNTQNQIQAKKSPTSTIKLQTLIWQSFGTVSASKIKPNPILF